MNLKDLDVFVSVVVVGSLAGAGRRLGVSAMAILRSLAALETELGVRLMHRTTRSISLTPEGEAFLGHARALLDLSEAARSSVTSDPEIASGTLKVTCPHLLGRAVLVPLLGELQRRQPSLQVELILSDDLIDIVEQGIDVAIRLAHPKDSRLVGRKLSDNPRALYAAPVYLERHGAPGALGDLSQHQGLRSLAMTSWPFMIGDELRPFPIPGRFACSSAEGVKEACLHGMGLAMLSYWDVEAEVATGRLLPLSLADAEAQNLPIWALMPSSRNVPTRVRLLIDELRQRLQTAPSAG